MNGQKIAKNSYEELALIVRTDWLRLAAQTVHSSDTKDEAEQRLLKMARDAEEARDEYYSHKG